jgi:flagellar protein FlbD
MILLTRLNGNEIYLNPDLIERIEVTPDTIVSLVDGKKYVAVEEPREIIDRIVAFRAAVLVAAEAEAEANAGRPGGGDRTGRPGGERTGRPSGGERTGQGTKSSFGALTPPRPLRLIDDTTE